MKSCNTMAIFIQGLRIENKRQSVVCSILLSSLDIACILTYYIYNER